MANSLSIFHQNVLNWSSNKESIIDSIYEVNPDIALINSTGTPDNKEIYIKGYKVLQTNETGEKSRGSAIFIKENIKFQQIPNLQNDLLAIQLQLKYDTLTLATIYHPFSCL